MKEINPLAVTKYRRRRDELEQFWIFCILVAGKDSDWAAQKVSDLLRHRPADTSPLEYLGHGHTLHNTLVANKVGQYYRVEKAIRESLEVDLRKATVEELDALFGVGPKTARFFILHTRPNADCVPLDTHILKFLRDNKVHDVPAETPQNGDYERLEGIARRLMRAKFSGLTLAQIDLLLWAKYSGRLDNEAA